VVVCNDPGFYQILGKFFFAFVLLEMIEISQSFKTFESILKALLENYFKPSIIFLKDFSASLLAKEKSYKVFYKASYAKGLLRNIFQKLF
jgi:hypothetical protein